MSQTERSHLTSQLNEQKLLENGIPVQVGVQDSETGTIITFSQINNGKYPTVAIWFGSNEPTDEEIEGISKYARKREDKLPGQKDGIFVSRANTIILNKIDGDKWVYRRAIWTGTTNWSQHPTDLEGLLNLI